MLKIPRLQIVGTHSGCGKTTVVCGILSALHNRGMKLSSLKCGPDYIDPMFHEKMIGTHSGNLDVFMNGEENILPLFEQQAADSDFTVIEGVMGMYDGIAFGSSRGSSNHISLLTKTPQILVVNVRGMSTSAVALARGFLSYEDNHIRGIILNNCTEASYTKYKEMLERALPVKVFGFFPQERGISLESRHLGLITAAETANIEEKIRLLGRIAEECLDINGLLELGKNAEDLEPVKTRKPVRKYEVKIAVARDRAFCFIYNENIDILKRYGAKILYFSPTSDKNVPEEADALMLFGGYPEEYAKELSENRAMKKSVRKFVESGRPVYAECGGFIYLTDHLKDRTGTEFEMCGAVSGDSYMTSGLKRFGYLSLTARKDTLLCKKGETLKAHEFHYSDSTNNGDGFIAEKQRKRWNCILCEGNLFAGYPHLHFGAHPEYLENLIKQAMEIKQNGIVSLSGKNHHAG